MEQGGRPQRHAKRTGAPGSFASFLNDDNSEELGDNEVASTGSDGSGAPKQKKARSGSMPPPPPRSGSVGAMPAPAPRRASAGAAKPPAARWQPSQAAVGEQQGQQAGPSSPASGGGGGGKKRNSNTKCIVDGCPKMSRGRNGCCRSHGGGIPCKSEGCKGFARLGGFCSKHGGYARCKRQGCEQRVVWHGLCTEHYLNKCTHEDCAAPPDHQDKCAKHGNWGVECQHSGCELPRQDRKSPWCAGHAAHHLLLEQKLAAEVEKDGEILQCRRVFDGRPKQCEAVALQQSHLCPTHQLLSTCGEVGCQRVAEEGGKCVHHAEASECSGDTCTCMAVCWDTSDPPISDADGLPTYQCTTEGCTARLYLEGMACWEHGEHHDDDDDDEELSDDDPEDQEDGAMLPSPGTQDQEHDGLLPPLDPQNEEDEEAEEELLGAPDLQHEDPLMPPPPPTPQLGLMLPPPPRPQQGLMLPPPPRPRRGLVLPPQPPQPQQDAPMPPPPPRPQEHALLPFPDPQHQQQDIEEDPMLPAFDPDLLDIDSGLDADMFDFFDQMLPPPSPTSSIGFAG